MRKPWIIGTSLGCLVLGLVTVILALIPSRPTVATTCTTHPGPIHTVTIQHNTIKPANLQARQCDQLTIINDDPQARLIAFGQHDHHEAYDGVTETTLAQNQHLTITLVQPGSFIYHDHLQDEVQGYFTVEPK